MKSTKRILSLLLALVLLIGNIPAVVFAAGEGAIVAGTTSEIEPAGASVVASGTCGENLTWKLNDEGTLTISGTGEMTDSPWRDSYDEIKKVIIKDGLTSIDGSAFFNCSNLMSITIPDSVTSIGGSAFFNCSDLTSITIPDSVTSIGHSAFDGCSSLTSIVIPDGVTSIGRYVFYECSSLASIVIPDSVTSIGAYSFLNCISLTSVEIPDSVSSIGYAAFDGCKNLASVVVPAGVTNVGAMAFSECDSLSHVFYGGTEEQWNSISFGNSNDALLQAKCHCEVDGLHITPNKKRTCTIKVLFQCDICGDLLFDMSYEGTHDFVKGSCTECGVKDDWKYSFSGGEITITGYYGPETAVKVPAKIEGYPVISLGLNAFYGSSGIPSIKIPDSVTSIGKDAFYGCTSLASIEIPNNVTGIGDGAFGYCDSLTSIVIPENVTSLGNSVFEHCIGLGTVIFLGNAPQFQENTFNEVITTVYYPSNNATWTADVMKNYGGNITWKVIEKLAEPVITVKAKASDGKPYVDWDKVEGAEKYFVYRSTKKSSGFERIKSTIKTAYTDTTAKTGTKYYYKVKAIVPIRDYNSDYSATKSCTAKLAQPEVSITGSSTSGKPIVKWETVTGAAKDRVYRATSEDGKYELVYTGVKARSYTDKTAKTGTTYYYKVRAIHKDSSLNSAWSNVVNRTCDLAKPEVTIKLKNGDPRLTWDKVDGAAKYYIYRANSKNGEYIKIKTTVSATSFTDTTAKTGRTYYYKVKAIHKNTDANSAYSSVKYITAK